MSNRPGDHRERVSRRASAAALALLVLAAGLAAGDAGVSPSPAPEATAPGAEVSPQPAPPRSTPPSSGTGPRAVFDGKTIAFDPGDGSKVHRWPAHNDTRCGHAPGKHAARPSDPSCLCPILPGVYELGPSEKAGRFFGGIWMPISGIPRARPELGTRRCGVHSHPTSWRTRSAGCIQMKKADTFAFARLVDAAIERTRKLPIEVRNPSYFAPSAKPKPVSEGR